MLWNSSGFSEFRTSLSKVLTLWHYVKVRQRYLSYGCATNLNTSHAILLGGSDHSTRSLLMNLETLEMTRGPDLAGHGRYHLACTQIRHSNGSHFVIAVGGKYRNKDSVSLDTTEIINADSVSNGWSPGKTELLNSCY